MTPDFRQDVMFYAYMPRMGEAFLQDTIMSNYGGNMNKRTINIFLIALSINTSVAMAQNSDHPGKIADDSALVAAVRSHRSVSYVEAANLTVTQLLPDDTSGRTHQKWRAQLSDGSNITVVYNTDLGNRVPVQVGSKFGVGGQYIQTGNSGLIHWLHDDPRHSRPDGYVYFNGIVYGDVDHEDN